MTWLAFAVWIGSLFQCPPPQPCDDIIVRKCGELPDPVDYYRCVTNNFRCGPLAGQL